MGGLEKLDQLVREQQVAKSELVEEIVGELAEKVKKAVLYSIDRLCDIISKYPEAMIVVDPAPIKEYHLGQVAKEYPEYTGAVRRALVNFFW